MNTETYNCIDCGKPLVRKDRVAFDPELGPPKRCGGCWLQDVNNWVCGCGVKVNREDAGFLWDGKQWCHFHEEIGHVPMIREETL